MRSCLCIADKQYDFTIDYREKDILYRDYSTWTGSDLSNLEESYDITVINKETGLEKTIKVGVGKSTSISYEALSDTDCGIDGIYTFRVESCGQTLERTEAVIPSLHCAYTKLLLRPNKTKKDEEDLIKIFIELDYLKSAARAGMTSQASEHFKILTTIIKQLGCSCG
jgi:hypothetical protein